MSKGTQRAIEMAVLALTGKPHDFAIVLPVFVGVAAVIGLVPACVGWMAWSLSGVGKSLFTGMLPEQLLTPSLCEVYCLYMVVVVVRCAFGRAIQIKE